MSDPHMAASEPTVAFDRPVPALRLGLVVGDGETTGFIEGIAASLARSMELRTFKRSPLPRPLARSGRLQHHHLRLQLDGFMRENDALLFEWASGLLALATRSPDSSRVPIVVRLHRYEMFTWVEHVDWRRVDAVVLVSRAMEAKLLERVPGLQGRTVVIPEAVDMRRFRPHAHPYRGHLGILCHLIPRKRVYELILAFGRVARLRPGLHLFVGGAPEPSELDYYDALRNLVRRLGISQRVTFDGAITDAPRWFDQIDLFISNSYSEGLQVAPMEAMASGCACLAHRWEGAEELLPESQLYWTEDELVTRVMEFDDLAPDERAALQARFVDHVRGNFELETVADRIRSVVLAEVDRHPRARGER